MKTLKIFSLIVLTAFITNFSFAQEKTETFKVAGECGMCKKKIEKTAKSAGASYAMWDAKTKELTVKYNNESTNAAKIQESIAKIGYDTPGFKATEDAYNKLDDCCKYDRSAFKAEKNCCGEKCEMKDGKCANEAACAEKGCCKDSEKCKAMGCCGHEHKHDAKAACCDKDSKEKMKCADKGCCKKS